eukprot:COSAG02_NODE_7_length_64539_cov_120.393482_37_plen_93_part_00
MILGMVHSQTMQMHCRSRTNVVNESNKVAYGRRRFLATSNVIQQHAHNLKFSNRSPELLQDGQLERRRACGMEAVVHGFEGFTTRFDTYRKL